MNDDELHALEGLLWEDVQSGGGWTRAADAVAAALQSRGSLLLPLQGRRPGVPRSDSMGEFEDVYFREKWHERDFRFTGVGVLRSRGIVVDKDLATQDVLDRQPSYQFLYRHGLKWFAAIPFSVGDDHWAFSVHRTPRQGAFMPEDQARLLRIRDVVQRHAMLSARMAQAHIDGVMDTFGALQGACALLDRTGRVVALNAPAEAMLGNGLRIADRRLAATRPHSDQALQRHLQAALWQHTVGDDPALLPVLVERVTGPPLVVRAVPFRGVSVGYFARARAILLISEINATLAIPIHSLQQLFGLAPGRGGPRRGTVAQSQPCGRGRRPAHQLRTCPDQAQDHIPQDACHEPARIRGAAVPAAPAALRLQAARGCRLLPASRLGRVRLGICEFIEFAKNAL